MWMRETLAGLNDLTLSGPVMHNSPKLSVLKARLGGQLWLRNGYVNVDFVSTSRDVLTGSRFAELRTYTNRGCPLQTGDLQKRVEGPLSGHRTRMLSKVSLPLSQPTGSAMRGTSTLTLSPEPPERSLKVTFNIHQICGPLGYAPQPFRHSNPPPTHACSCMRIGFDDPTCPGSSVSSIIPGASNAENHNSRWAEDEFDVSNVRI